MSEGRPSLRFLRALSCVHAGVFLLAYALLSGTPGPRATDPEILDFYGSPDRLRLVLVGLFVMPFAGIAFLWLGSALRVWLRSAGRQEDAFVAGLQRASGTIYVTLFFAAAAASSVTAVNVELSQAPLDPMLARQLPQLGRTLLLVFGMRMAAMFVFTTSRLTHSARVLPRWFELVSLAAGVFLLFNTFLSREIVLIFPLWLVILCALLRGPELTSRPGPPPADGDSPGDPGAAAG